MTDRLNAIYIIEHAQPGHDIALYDLGTRSVFLRGFEMMRAIALNAVSPKKQNGALEAVDFKWPEGVK